MKRLKEFLFCMALLMGSTGLKAGVEEAKPVNTQLYASVYEQQALLKALQGEQQDALVLLLANAPGMDAARENAVREELTAFIRKFKKKQQRYSEKGLLQKLYFAVHRTFLKEYQPYRNFYALISEGTYNCLTATALYGYLLDQMGFSYQVYETDYHIFLQVYTSGGESILIESTDPLYGFVEGKEQMVERLKQIKQDALPNATAKRTPYHDFDLNILREISLAQLAGLQYFNQAAALYNSQRIADAETALGKGRLLYQAERFDRFARLLADVQQ